MLVFTGERTHLLGATLISVLELLVFTLHLMAVDIAAVLPLVCVALYWYERGTGIAAAGLLGRRLAIASIMMLLTGVLLGLAAALLLTVAGDDRFMDGLRRMPPRRLWFGVAELVFSVACMLAYRVTWSWKRLPGWIHSLVAFAAATNLLYHFPMLFVAISMAGSVADLPQTEAGYVNVVRVMLLPETLARLSHHLAAAVIVTVVYVLRRLTTMQQLAQEAGGQKLVHWLGVWGARVGLIAAMLQVLLGGYLIMQVPRLVRDQLLGGDTITAVVFAGSILGAIALMHQLAAVAWGELGPQQIRRCLLFTFLVMFLMTAARHRSRSQLPVQKVPATATDSPDSKSLKLRVAARCDLPSSSL